MKNLEECKTQMAPPEFLYRFRSIDSLLGKFQELENQEIYFASPEQLNDPLEGFKDIYWRGDEIIWRNLLKHYLLCLEQVCSLYILSGEDSKIVESDIPVFKIEADFPTPQYGELFKKIRNSVFANESIKKLPGLLASRVMPVRKNELTHCLRHIHFFVVNEIFNAYEEKKFISTRPHDDALRKAAAAPMLDPSILKLVNDLDCEHPGDKNASEIAYGIFNTSSMQMDLINRYNLTEPVSHNKMLLFSGFPDLYVKSIEKLAYGDWYTACFLGSCNNPAMWGYYGNNHTGVCLKFKSKIKDGKAFLPLLGMNGWSSVKGGASGPTFGQNDREFYKVDYKATAPEISFFESLGRPNRMVLNDGWYRDENGNESSSAKGIFRDEENWRRKYWNDFYKCITTKLEGWAHEDEYRLILSPSMMDFSKPEARKLKFQLSDLDGIIFGVNTSIEDKLKIMKLIDQKCTKENYKGFNFYQASFVRGKSAMEIDRLSLITHRTTDSP